jgi:hypothetical protein
MVCDRVTNVRNVVVEASLCSRFVLEAAKPPVFNPIPEPTAWRDVVGSLSGQLNSILGVRVSEAHDCGSSGSCGSCGTHLPCRRWHGVHSTVCP